jgi:hypothetical protein
MLARSSIREALTPPLEVDVGAWRGTIRDIALEREMVSLWETEGEG